MDERERRIGLNEAVFREVNERLGALPEGFGGATGELEVVCECGDAASAEQFALGAQQYAEIRSDPTLFVIVPGHEYDSTEEVVEHGDGFDIVRKRSGGPAELASTTALPGD